MHQIPSLVAVGGHFALESPLAKKMLEQMPRRRIVFGHKQLVADFDQLLRVTVERG